MQERNTYISFGKHKDFSIDFLLAMMKDARVTTLNRVFDLREDELHYQYSEGWNSISVLLAHIYSVEMYFRISFIEKRNLTTEEEKDIMPGLEMGEFIPEILKEKKSLKYFIDRLEISRKTMKEAILKLSTEAFHKKQDGYNPKTGFNLAWALYHMSEDEIHHRGQISIVRKLYKVWNERK